MKLIVILTFFSLSIWAYPQFISKGYSNCLTCHYNPFGNGPLTDYGRAVSASAIADRLFVPNSISDDDLGNSSGFLFNTPKNKWFRPALDYRGLQIDRAINSPDDTESSYITMQADATVTLQFGKRNNFIITGTYSYIPEDNPGQDEAETFSREHYIGYRPMKELGIYVGKMDKLFGLRIPDHIAYSKTQNNLSLRSQSHSVLGHWLAESYEVGIQYFDGDKEKSEDEQTQGLAASFEYNLSDATRVGTSVLNETLTNDDIQNVKAFFVKMKIAEASSLMAELGQNNKELNSGGEKVTQYFFLQNHLYLKRGLYLLMNFEYLKADVKEDPSSYRLGPGLQYYPWQRVELRVDLSNTKSYGSSTNTNDRWDLLSQIHLWF